MTRPVRLGADWSCPHCGGAVTVHTAADQARAAELDCDWWAYDGDVVTCDGCAGLSKIWADGENAEVVADEEES